MTADLAQFDRSTLESRRQVPMVAAAVAVILGLTIGRVLPVPGWAWVLFAVASLLAWGGTELWRPSAQRRRVASVLLGIAIVCAAGGLWAIDQRQVASRDVVRLVTSEAPQLMTCRIHVSTTPRVQESDPDLPFYLAMASTSFVGDVSEVLTTAGWIAASGKVLVRVRGQPALKSGQRVEIEGWARRPVGPLNPGEFDYARYLAASRIFVTVTATRPEQIRVVDAAASVDCLESFRTWARSKLAEHTVPRDEEAGLTLTALLLGQRDPGMESVGRAFTDAGGAHLLAISGAHIVIVAGIVWWLCRAPIRRPQIRTIVTLGVVLAYVAATPCGPPILRAAVAAVLLAVARFARRPTSGMNLLATALIVVLVLRPADLLDAGLQLSFGCTAGLILFGDRLYEALFGRWIERRARIARAIGSRIAHWVHIGRRWMAGYVAANIIGGVIAAPLVSYHFQQANPLAVLSGIVLLPLVTLAMIAGGIQMLATAIAPSLGEWLAPATTAVAGIMVWSVRLVANLPGAVTAVRAPPVWSVAVLYGVVVLWAVRRRVGASRATVAVAGSFAITLVACWYAWTAENRTRATALATGDGSCIVLETAGGRTLVIDAGANRPHITGRVIGPFLRSRGINGIDALVITHTNPQWSNGAADLADLSRPASVFCSAADVRGREWSYDGDRMLGRLEHRKISPVPLSAGAQIRFDRDVTCDVLWPPDALMVGRSSGLVLRLTIGGKQMLILAGRDGPGLRAVGDDQTKRIDAVVITGSAPARDLLESAGVRAPGLVVTGKPSPNATVVLSEKGAATLTFAGDSLRCETYR